MIRVSLKIALLSLLFSICLLKMLFSQGQRAYAEFYMNTKWSFAAGTVVYNKAELTTQYGALTFKNKPMSGFNAGVLYNFQGSISLLTSLHLPLKGGIMIYQGITLV